MRPQLLPSPHSAKPSNEKTHPPGPPARPARRAKPDWRPQSGTASGFGGLAMSFILVSVICAKCQDEFFTRFTIGTGKPVLARNREPALLQDPDRGGIVLRDTGIERARFHLPQKL